MGINHAKKLGLENIIAKPAIAEAVGNNVKILGKIVVNIKINEYLTQNLKIDMLNTESKYILLSNKHQSQIGISKDQKKLPNPHKQSTYIQPESSHTTAEKT